MTRKPARSAASSVTTISEIRRGESCRMISIKGGQSFRAKVLQIGLRESARVKVLQNAGFGPLLLEIGGTRLMLGRRMAERLWVSRK